VKRTRLDSRAEKKSEKSKNLEHKKASQGGEVAIGKLLQSTRINVAKHSQELSLAGVCSRASEAIKTAKKVR
jgi:hypothetical protein